MGLRIAIVTTDNRELKRDYGAPHPHFGTAPEALMQGFALLPEVEVHVLSCIRQKVESPQQLAPNIYFHSLPVAKLGWMRTGYLGCIRAVRSKLKAICPDIVHGQGTELDCSMDAVYSDYPNVITIHGNMGRIAEILDARPFSFYWNANILERHAIRRSMGVVCISSYTEKRVSMLARKTWMVPNAIDQAFFDISSTPGLEPPVVFCVANVSPWKNQIHLIKCLDELARGTRFTLRFAGAADIGSAYAAEFLREVEARPWCQFIGSLSREELRRELAAVSILALPSIEDNCPMAILEAMAAGVPVVAANIGGIPDLVRPGQTGLLFDPSDAESIRKALAPLLNEPMLRESFGKAAKALAFECFHPRKIAEQHVAIYRELLASGN